MSDIQNLKLSKSVKSRNRYTCRDCGYFGKKSKHIDLIFDIENGITLRDNYHRIEHKNDGLL
jgi:hypothetical protein